MSFIPKLVFCLVVNAAAFYVLDLYALEGSLITIGGGISGYALVALIFAVLNSLVKPILEIISLPIKWLTLGLFSLVINAVLVFLLEMVTATLQPGDASFVVNEGIKAYIIVGLVLAVVNGFVHYINTGK